MVALPGVAIVDHECFSLLGSPLRGVPSIDRALKEKLEALRFMGSHFAYMSTHDALTLLRHSFSIPKLCWMAPCFLSNHLEEYDLTLHSIRSSVTNTPLMQSERAWLQATLPVKSSGLSVRHAVDLAPSAYLASTSASADIVSATLGQPSKALSFFPTTLLSPFHRCYCTACIGQGIWVLLHLLGLDQ